MTRDIKVGFITIGQSPRTDIIPEIMPILGNNIKIIECGALDDLSLNEIKKLAPKDNDYILVTRLRDGTQVMLSRSKIIDLMQKCIEKLEKDVNLIGLLCTGDFPELKSNILMIEPSKLTMNVVKSMNVKKLGIFVPDKSQINLIKNRWLNIVNDVTVVSSSAYINTIDKFKELSKQLIDTDLIVLDSFGYSITIKKTVAEITKKPIILPRTLLVRVIKELLEI
ncbi:AroM family protein [Caldivirga maquilingensis]|uniref:AroM family protein n=1 Tax=Caldivirga maquilingensis (strain ATCC 700844 / DSM 13496 / JCM 10307 / IC-167) TaxID=397948 RepID=A8MB15_CALMQ|nr:AroM family protein [Caldivirga maquilingensis]ABW02644.1 AroM family protein [Caldivirga maquilingensis IC-167]